MTAAILDQLHPSWREVLAPEFSKPYMAKLQEYVAAERAGNEVFPPADEVFSAFNDTPFDQVRVVILGQDPYHGPGQAHGLCFSVKRGVRVPPSLRNMYKELLSDLGITAPKHGNLSAWAQQGVLMTNTVLTVRRASANSHRKKGWETFTDQVIREINARRQGVIFVLWGAPSKKKAKMIDADRHIILSAPHPSPLSARRGFFGSKPYSTINQHIVAQGGTPIDWSLPA